GRRAHDRGEVENTGGARIDDLGQCGPVSNIASGHLQACVCGDGRLWYNRVRRHYGIDKLFVPTGAHEPAPLQQGPCQTPPQKPSTASDDDFHDLLPSSCSLSLREREPNRSCCTN